MAAVGAVIAFLMLESNPAGAEETERAEGKLALDTA